MDQELQELGERIERMLSLSRRLADENIALRHQLATATVANEQLQQRIADARARVEAALARLPAPAAAPEAAPSDIAAP
jgi:uncharacterized protein (TIGR02449 family)